MVILNKTKEPVKAKKTLRKLRVTRLGQVTLTLTDSIARIAQGDDPFLGVLCDK